MTDANVPHYNHMLWPILQAVDQLGGSAQRNMIFETVIEHEIF